MALGIAAVDPWFIELVKKCPFHQGERLSPASPFFSHPEESSIHAACSGFFVEGERVIYKGFFIFPYKGFLTSHPEP